MANRTVTVIGATGFLGRHTVRALAKAGWRIKAAARHPAQGFFLRPMGSVGQIELVKCNVTNPDSVATAVHGANAVVNLTGILFEKGQSFSAVQAEGATHVAQAAANAGISNLIHISAIGADFQSDSVYARTKADGEQGVRQAIPNAVILRPSLLFGPEDSFFNKFAAMARLFPALPLIGGGHTRFQPVFAGDVAAAIVSALEKETARGRTFALGGPAIYSFRELMEIVLKETGRNRALISIPFGLAKLKAAFLQMLPNPLLTIDQVRLLGHDNVVEADQPGLADLGIAPTLLEAVLPSYLWRYRPTGEYDSGPAAV